MKAAPIVPARGRLFSARSAAEYLGVTESKVRHLIARGELVAVRTTGGRLEGIYEAECDAWVARHSHAAAPPVNARQVAADERIKLLMPKERVFA